MDRRASRTDLNEGETMVEPVGRSLVRRWLTALVVVATGASTLAMTRSAYAADGSRTTMKRAKVEAADLSVAHPSEWVRFSLTDGDLESLGAVLEAENPEVSEAIAAVDSSAFELNVHDPIDGDSVYVRVARGVLLGGKRSVRAVLEAQLADVPGFEIVRTRDVTVGDRRGVRVDYRLELAMGGDEEDSLPVYEIGIFLPVDGGKVASVDIAVDDEPADIAMADKIARSIRPL